MLQNLIVVLIVGASAWYAGMKYLPPAWRARLGWAKPAAGCGSGCDTCNKCNNGAEPEPVSGAQRVIKLHRSS